MSPPRSKRRKADPVFFMDRNLGAIIAANKLRGRGARIQLHDDHFDQRTDDSKWLPEVGRRGWANLTQDARILHRQPEIVALIRANTHVFILKAKTANGEQIANAFCLALPSMIKLIRLNDPPLLARVTLSGNVKEIEGYKALQDRLYS